MAYEDAVKLPSGQWFDLSAFQARVLALGAAAPSNAPRFGSVRLASGQLVNLEDLVLRLGSIDGVAAVRFSEQGGISLPNGSVYDAASLNSRLIARDGGASLFMAPLARGFLPAPDYVKISGVPGGPSAPQPITISGTPGDVSVGDSPTFAPVISGGTPPYILSRDSGTLPPGRTVNGSAGTVTGSYTTAGTYNYVLKATDALGATATLAVAIVVSAPVDLLATAKAAYAAANAGTKAMVIHCIGDSLTAGFGAGTPPSGLVNGAKAGSYPGQLSARFQANGFQWPGSTIWGIHGTAPADKPSYNPEVTAMGDWIGTFATSLSVGGRCLANTVTNPSTSHMTWAPGQAFDQLDIYTPHTASLGAFNVVADGATLATVTESAAPYVFSKQTVPVALASRTLSLQKTSGNVQLIGLEAYNTANKKAVRVRNFGNSGSTTTVWTTTSTLTGAKPLDALAALTADLHIVMLGTNDYNGDTGGTGIDGFKTRLRQIIAAAKTNGGSVLLMAPNYTNFSNCPQSTQDAYTAAIQTVASEDGYKFFDWKTVLGTMAQMQANGDISNDNTHLVRQGYGKIDAALHALITAA